MVQTQIARNTIRSLTTEQGTVLTSTVDIKKEAVSYFQRFLQSQDASGEEVSVNDLRNLLIYRCPAEACATLVAPVIGLEIQAALHALPNDKVSGPDGYFLSLLACGWKRFRHYCNPIFFLFGFLPTGINATILALIPKTETAQKMKDYKPISCCNLI